MCKSTEEQWNNMWDLWAEEKIDSPYRELMTYHGEINNGGHDQYFTNIANSGELNKEISALKSILPSKHYYNLEKAYKAFLALEKNEDDENAQKTIEECDDMFYENEEEINRILEEHSSHI